MASNNIFIVTNTDPIDIGGTSQEPEVQQNSAKAMYDYVSRMMAHYLPWDADFRQMASDRTVLDITDDNHPFLKVLEYSDLIRENGKIEINYSRLGLVKLEGNTVDEIVNGPEYINPKINEHRDIFPRRKARFHHKTPSVVIFGSASSGDDSCVPIGKVIGGFHMTCIVGGNGIKENNAMKLIAKTAHDFGASKVDMVTTGYLYHAQGASLTGDTVVHIASTMHERMDLFWKHGMVFLAVKGGLGAIMEVLFIVQKNIENQLSGKPTKPVWVYNHNHFWDTFEDILKQLKIDNQVKFFTTIDQLRSALRSVNNCDNL